MLLIWYVSSEVYFMKAWNTPGTKGDSAQLCYLDKIAGERSTLVSSFYVKNERESQWIVFKSRKGCFIPEKEQPGMMVLSRDLFFRS